MRVAVVDYGSGNLRSVAKAIEAVGACVQITDDADTLISASHIVLPGVGAFGDCAQGLAARQGVLAALAEAVLKQGKPFLGLCVGMQLLAARGYEFGEHDGLNWLGGNCIKLTPQAGGLADASLKIPHMGWSQIKLHQPDHPLLREMPTQPWLYFVHSYHLSGLAPAHILASADYGGEMVAACVRDNVAGFQFHPEKSQKLGLQLLKNFVEWRT